MAYNLITKKCYWDANQKNSSETNLIFFIKKKQKKDNEKYLKMGKNTKDFI